MDIEIPRQPLNYQSWKEWKSRFMSSVKSRGEEGIFPLAKVFNEVLSNCEPGQRMEIEKRAYGLAPPEILRPLQSDQEGKLELKKKLYRCCLVGICSWRRGKDSRVPMILVPIRREEHWDLLTTAGFLRHQAGDQFVCLNHFRDKSLCYFIQTKGEQTTREERVAHEDLRLGVCRYHRAFLEL